MSFGIEPDRTEKDVDYDVDEENFLVDFVRFSRSKQVLNEEQAAIVQMAIATGMLADYEFYTSVIVTGGSAGGKSHMLNRVNFEAMSLANDAHGYVYELTGGSDKAGIDDEKIDSSRIAYFHELQKIPDEMLEFIKTISEDGSFKYGRNIPDPDAHGGRTTAHIERDPLPVVFSFADENEASAGKDQELRTRTVEVKVDENPQKNEGVHDSKWGGERIEIEGSEHEYMFDDPDMESAVKTHLRDMPRGVNVVIPYGNGAFEGDDWCAADVVRPMFNFARSESTRASANLAGLTMGSAILNYHARDTVCERCKERFGPEESQSYSYSCPHCDDAALHLIVEPHDVANVIACRRTLLATTHDLTEKKFAILDAILAVGGTADKSGTAVQATKQDIVEEIQKNEEISTLTKTEIDKLLDELDEHLIINKTDNPQDRRENLYIYDGGAVFKRPNVYKYPEKFDGVMDPIREQPITETIEEQLRELNAKMDATEEAETAESGQSTLADAGASSLDEVEQHVAERLSEVLGGKVVPQSVVDDDSLRTEHMVGATPVEYGRTVKDGSSDDGFQWKPSKDGDEVRPARAPSGADRTDGLLSPEHVVWDDDMGINDVERAVDRAIDSLKKKGVLKVESVEGGVRFAVEA